MARPRPICGECSLEMQMWNTGAQVDRMLRAVMLHDFSEGRN